MPLPLRTRLTLWYTTSLGLILLLFASFLYVQLRRQLLSQLDIGLDVVATQALLNVGVDDEQFSFQNLDTLPQTSRLLNDDFMIYLIAADGTVVDEIGREPDAPTWNTLEAGYVTLMVNGERWRVISRAVERGRVTGWVQVVQELEPVEITLRGLRSQMLIGLPLALLLAGLGGYFLAGRALHPIDQITHTAQAIHADNLQRRIAYTGPADEVGRLAGTFDAMLDRLQASFARERRFTSDAAHELRTPLTALKGRLDVTLSQSRPPQAYVATLQEMQEQVDRLIRLSNDLLFMARLDTGQFIPHREAIQAKEFLDTVLDQIRPFAAAKVISINETIPAGLTLYGDMELLIRLFLNLLDNAVKYTPEQGKVTIAAAASHPHIAITITDTGPGIRSQHLPHLFERFYRAEPDRGRQGQAGGAGLGLAIAYDIAQAHGGIISVITPVQDGHGSTFIVQLPMSKPHS